MDWLVVVIGACFVPRLESMWKFQLKYTALAENALNILSGNVGYFSGLSVWWFNSSQTCLVLFLLFWNNFYPEPPSAPKGIVVTSCVQPSGRLSVCLSRLTTLPFQLFTGFSDRCFYTSLSNAGTIRIRDCEFNTLSPRRNRRHEFDRRYFRMHFHERKWLNIA